MEVEIDSEIFDINTDINDRDFNNISKCKFLHYLL